MDIIEFVKRFLKAHENSETNKMLTILERHNLYLANVIRVIDNSLSWASTNEGFYYFYFLQIRLLLAAALLLYEDRELDKCCEAIEIGQEIIRYSDHYQSLHASRKMPISQAEFWKYRNYYENRFQKISNLLNEKNY
jgi:hypothetical protein